MRRGLSGILRFAATGLTLLLVPYLVLSNKAFDWDPDIWWHIRVGDWMAQHHAVPHAGIFSQHIERPWTAYSWGFELLVSGIHSVFGLPGIPGLLICLEILISLTFLVAIRRITGSFWKSWWIATAGIVACYVDLPRPALLTLLFFTLELLLIFDTERTGDDRLLYWMGPLFVVWANCHIQFVYGIAILALYIGSRILFLMKGNIAQGSTLSSTSAPKLLIGIFAIAVAGSCIGPNGWLPYRVALGYAGHTFVYQIIQELTAMNFRRPEHYVELLLVMAACFAVGRSKRRDLFRPLLLAVTAMVSFRSMRDMWFAAMAASFVIGEAVREGSGTPAETQPPTLTWETLSYALAAVLAMTLSFGYGIRHGMSAPDMIGQIDRIYPVRATEFIRDSHLQGPMYNTFNWGGFLTFNLRDQAVSIDGRADLYGDELLQRAMATTNGDMWQSDTDLARANLVILDRYLPLTADLAKDADYRLVYQDRLATVFVKQ